MKYEYLLKTWGGFYNKEYKDIHGEVSGLHYFNTKEERDEYLKKLSKIESEMGANALMSTISEGYHTRTITTLHRVIKWKNKEYYSSRKLSPNYPYEGAKYCLENNWYTGFNDYPLGYDFDYENNDIEVVQEWITGAFEY